MLRPPPSLTTPHYQNTHRPRVHLVHPPQVPFLVVALVPISCIALLLGTRYLNASRELKRLDSVSKSPIYAHFTESVNGVSTMCAALRCVALRCGLPFRMGLLTLV